MKAFAIISKSSSDPDLDRTVTPYTGHVFIGSIAGWGAYILSGTQAQLNAIAAMPGAYVIAYTSDPQFNDWPELQGVVNTTVRTELNTWLTKYSLSNIPADCTYQTIISKALVLYANNSPALADVVSAAFRTAVNVWLTARGINNIPETWTYSQICAVIQNKFTVHWAELDDVIDATLRTKLNTWLTARGFSTIPAAWTNRQAITALFRRLRGDYDFIQCDVMDSA